MAESGGPTTQSGIYYQNTVATRYLGALLDLRTPKGHSRVVSVRIEAPEHIDDIVVSYADGSRLLIQAKESLASHGEPWTKLWLHAAEQHEKSKNNRDDFLLVIGNACQANFALRELFERAQGKEDEGEWASALNEEQKALVSRIRIAMGSKSYLCFDMARRMSVELLPLAEAETIGTRDWLPPSSGTPAALFSQLRDCCGGAARIRQTLRADQLSELLLAKYGLRFFGSHTDGLEKYLRAIASEFDHVSLPGTSISAHEATLFIWPTTTLAAKGVRSDFEDENQWSQSKSTKKHLVELRNFPTADARLIVLESAAGHGKSTILKFTARRLAMSSSYVPAYVHAEVLSRHLTIQDYLSKEHNSIYGVDIDWYALCEQGRGVVLLDGLDELDDSSRALLVSNVTRHLARFPDVPMLIGTRDSAIAELPPRFGLCRVEGLDRRQMISMLERYLTVRGGTERQNVVSHVFNYSELEQLCRVPLFVALFVATLPKDGKIPTSRTDLLERFVLHSLSPERHKGGARANVSKLSLRRSAEAMAFLCLKEGKASLSERELRACLAKDLGDAVGDSCFETLLQYGLIQRRGVQVSFSIPTVQEYLAGCHLAESGGLATVDWLNSVYRRPWSQAIQFAIERVVDADGLLRQQLERSDDMFYTSLRLVARCVVNGASVKPDLKTLVADKLANAWTRSPHGTSWRIGTLIADGFASPPSQVLRQELLRPKSFINERPRVIRVAADDALTLKCLEALLTQSDIRELWSTDWQTALQPVLDEAIKSLLRFARASTSHLSWSVIAEVFYRLRLERVDWDAVAEDTTIPSIIRAAAQFGTSLGATDSILIDAAINESVEGHLWESFYEAYSSTVWWKTHLRTRCRDMPSPTGNILNIVLSSEAEAATELLSVLSEIASDPSTHPDNKFLLQVVLGGHGMDQFSDAAIDQLKSANLRQIHVWLFSALNLPSAKVCRAADILEHRKFAARAQIEILQQLEHAATSTARGTSKSIALHGPFTVRSTPNEVSTAVIAWVDRLLCSEELTAIDRRDLAEVAAHCGSERHEVISRMLLEEYLDSCTKISDADWPWVIGTVWRAFDGVQTLSTGRLRQILDKGAHQPVATVAEKLIEIEGPACHDEMVEYLNSGKSAAAKLGISMYFETHAERHGLNLHRVNGKWTISRPLEN
jgi:hypothetical protein